jgi:hypothetical protein
MTARDRTLEDTMITLPLWAVFVVSFGTPIAAFIGVILGHWVTRKGDIEAAGDRLRQEMMSTLRWAGERAASDDKRTAYMAQATVDAVVSSCCRMPFQDHQWKLSMADAISRFNEKDSGSNGPPSRTTERPDRAPALRITDRGFRARYRRFDRGR